MQHVYPLHIQYVYQLEKTEMDCYKNMRCISSFNYLVMHTGTSCVLANFLLDNTSLPGKVGKDSGLRILPIILLLADELTDECEDVFFLSLSLSPIVFNRYMTIQFSSWYLHRYNSARTLTAVSS